MATRDLPITGWIKVAASAIGALAIIAALIGWGYTAEERMCRLDESAHDHELRLREVEREGSEARQWRRQKDQRDKRIETKLDRALGIAP